MLIQIPQHWALLQTNPFANWSYWPVSRFLCALKQSLCSHNYKASWGKANFYWKDVNTLTIHFWQTHQTNEPVSISELCKHSMSCPYLSNLIPWWINQGMFYVSSSNQVADRGSVLLDACLQSPQHLTLICPYWTNSKRTHQLKPDLHNLQSYSYWSWRHVGKSRKLFLTWYYAQHHSFWSMPAVCIILSQS